MDLQLAGKTALITGSYRGTGRGIAGVLAAEGAHVVIHGFASGQADPVAQELVDAGFSAEAVTSDIRSDASMDHLVDVASRVDVLVNNYGAPGGSSWSSMVNWEEEWNVNVLAAVRVTQACMPAMRDRGWGRIIFMGTVGTQQPGNRNVGYYGAKTALPTLVRTLAMELLFSLVCAADKGACHPQKEQTMRMVVLALAEVWETANQTNSRAVNLMTTAGLQVQTRQTEHYGQT